MTKQHDFQNDIDAIARSKTVPTLLETVILATGMGFAAVARVTASRWVTCRAVDQISFGLTPGDELDVESTLCHEVRQFDREIVIDDVRSDPVYINHHCPLRYGFRSYVSVPIRRADGSFFGTLCAIDPEPRSLKNDRVLDMFRLFAKMIGEILDAEEELTKSKDDLSHERALAGVQEQFIAILAHDLRNPVSALTAGLRLIERGNIDSQGKDIVALMRASVNRMGLLIENLLDQARKRNGAGIVINRTRTDDLAESLAQIIAEIQAVAPEQDIRADIDLPVPVSCDPPRVSQLFSNLLANAASHGAQEAPIRISARATEQSFTLSVANGGKRIPDDMLPTLFMPFERGNNRPSRKGLGLGLFIASEIASGHDGTLTVKSSDLETVFIFHMPNNQQPPA
ncbi:histidine kinase [Salipiger aestuarii]|uniref:histidine kinase n=1 Tax=Salipiger aestuarii TaxID=568098 RepID=A0A327Y852_9RHOB|nr:HAMP domain-containing sensor histidine kinase [Salipiger aestuarii]EIE50976.1 GAF sensor signal transduction histidine kinase [Citreicella sp. 357]KAA8607370.1 histidine kinase [Salipiger aestuarii]KAB2541777.1 histidine kinase [Salipiger aestuarii]RAK17220.1 signal transduction histidine kinase [Salipiger aestuarii]